MIPAFHPTAAGPWAGPALGLLVGVLMSTLPSSRLAAQEADPRAVQPERPTVATHAGTVAPGWLEIETGVERDRFDDGSHGVGFPTVFKLGLLPRAQLNLQAPFADPPGGSIGLGDLSLGIKWRLADAAPVVNDFALLPSVKVPSGSAANGTGTGTTDFSLLAISSRRVGPVAIDLNAGYTIRSGDGTSAPEHASVWTASFGFPLSGSLGAVAELYGYPSTSGPAGSPGIVALLAGPTFTLHPWLALDAGVILKLSGPQPRAIYVGAVWNTGQLWGGGKRTEN
ncbi:MAG: transporter [Gemmatimonadales bacterium]